MNTNPKIYIAGPQVFLPNAQEYYDKIQHMCNGLGLQALCPYDENIVTAKNIYLHNLDLIRQADGAIADVNPFRGTEMDSGTAWEIGALYTLDKPVVGHYREHITMRARAINHVGVSLDSTHATDSDPNLILKDGMRTPGFGLPVNLMIGLSVLSLIHGDESSALLCLNDFLKGQQRRSN